MGNSDMVRSISVMTDPQFAMTRIRIKEAVIAKLIAGRLLLLRTAARFRPITVKAEPIHYLPSVCVGMNERRGQVQSTCAAGPATPPSP